MAVAGGFPGGSVGPGHSSHAELANLRARLAQEGFMEMEKATGFRFDSWLGSVDVERMYSLLITR